MAQEIERKFLVQGQEWRGQAVGRLYRQGYLPTTGGMTVRVRIVETQAYLTLKGPSRGATRAEYEYAIPLTDAQEILATLCCGPQIEKYRYAIAVGELVWEVDEFRGDNQGLILAEVELSQEGQYVPLPAWIGAEVTGDRRYDNASLAQYPYGRWGKEDQPSASPH
jgi:CYTH domain-containing protein